MDQCLEHMEKRAHDLCLKWARPKGGSGLRVGQHCCKTQCSEDPGQVDLDQAWWIRARIGGSGPAFGGSGPGLVDLCLECARSKGGSGPRIGQSYGATQCFVGQEWRIWVRIGGAGPGMVDLGQDWWIWARSKGGSVPRIGQKLW